MSGIVLFGGTFEGRRIAQVLHHAKIELHICVATEYGASLLPEGDHTRIYAGRMDAEQMSLFLHKIQPELCLDATHPYAIQVTENIRRACTATGTSCLRILRREEEGRSNCIYKENMDEAVAFLEKTRGRILITTGSRDLEKYTALTDYQNRCVARVLPTLSVMEKCLELGFEGRNLIGMQGPFDREMNLAMLRQTKASWLVTKSSGKEGGFLEKCQAAEEAGVQVLVIGRPKEEGSSSMDSVASMELEEALAYLKESYKLPLEPDLLFQDFGNYQKEDEITSPSVKEDSKELYMIGMGPGDVRLLTQEARDAVLKADVLIGAKRIVEIALKTIQNGELCEKPYFICYKKEEIYGFLQKHPEYKRIALLYSGDIGFYSGARDMEPEGEYEIHRISGLASPIYFLNRLGIPWNEVQLMSCHGQHPNLIPVICRKKKTAVLLGKKVDVSEICEQLLNLGMEEIRITVGERLSYAEERISRGTPGEFMGKEFDALAIALFENPSPKEPQAGFGIEDESFLRGKVPMTKEEIRVLSFAKLGLREDSILWDVGAGTGSISIEAALQCSRGKVYAVERKPEAVELLRQNRKRFQAGNLTIIEGEAPDCLRDLPAPSHVFVGGSGGKLLPIIEAAHLANPSVRLVLNALTLQTLAKLEEIRHKFPEYEQIEILHVQIARNQALGHYEMMHPENPVYIISFGGEEEACD